MLDDNERRALAELEQRVVQADPEFAARMSSDPGDERPFPTIPVLCALLFISTPLVMLLFGWPGVVIAIDLFAASLAVTLIRRNRR
ncbi:DUF3040 domain-containing protein [Actinoplanes sp. NPDC051851]|uniref:DUF3040 domain-containing protein n=1 Tax=Actinoplanes sp. NPDC051851 TaxID=3154753 RepID=UPI00342BB048